jgi:hypothetical protein
VSSVTVNLPDAEYGKLRELSEQMGTTPEELVRISIDELLTAPDEKFGRATEYLLEKNSVLYKRLA